MNSKRREAGFERTRVAQLAARLLVEGQAASFGAAKRKAAAASGYVGRDLPDNLMLLAALIEYQQIFERDTCRQRNERLRRAALDAMMFLRDFEPRLHGAVMFGTTVRDSAVGLHLFEDEVERLSRFLLDRRVPYHLTTASANGRRTQETFPTFELCRDHVDFQLTVLPRNRLRQPPASPLDAEPYRYLTCNQLKVLIDTDPGGLHLGELEFSLLRYRSP